MLLLNYKISSDDGQVFRPTIDEAVALLANPETSESVRVSLEEVIDREINFRQADGAIDEAIPVDSLSISEKIKVLRRIDRADDEKPLFGHIENRFARKRLRRQFNRLALREVRALRRVVLRASRGTNRESRRAVAAKCGGHAAVSSGGRSDDGGSGSSGDSDSGGSGQSDQSDPDLPRPGPGTFYQSFVIKTRFNNLRRYPRRSCCVFFEGGRSI